MTTTTSRWRNHTKSNPCPICGKPDRCKFTDDGTHRCFRSSGSLTGWQLVKTCKDGTGIYRDINRPMASATDARRPSPQSAETSSDHPLHDWAGEAAGFTKALTPEQLNELAQQIGVTPESLRLIECGWANEADLHRLNASGKDWALKFPIGAWSFPERDADGKVIGLSFRALDGSKGSPKGARRGLIVPRNLNEHTGPVLEVEGATDVAASLTMGLMAVGRPSNTGGGEHLVALLSGRECLVVGENDLRLDDGGVMCWPGRDGAESIASKQATTWGKPVAMSMPSKPSKDARAWLNAQNLDVGDPDRCTSAGERFLSALQASAVMIEPGPPNLVFNVEQVRNRARSNVRVLVDDQLTHIDSVNLNDSKARTKLAERIAAKDPRITAEMVEKELLRRASGEQPKRDNDAPRSREELLAEQDERTVELLKSMPEHVREEAEALLLDPKLVNVIVSDIESMGVVGERELGLSIYSIGTSRLLMGPLAGITQGTTSSGKSFTQQKTSLLFPDESVFIATDLSPMSLYYLPNGRLMHCFVVAGERSRTESDDQANAKKALREMLSGGELSKAIPIKINGRMETVLIRQYGPIAYIESTTLTDVFDEDMNRCLPLCTDESREQNRRVMDAIALQAQVELPDTTQIIQRHHAIQRMLKRVRVRIPFASKIAAAMPCERPEGRRAINHTLHMIQTIALLHQRQRASGPLEHGDIIEATHQDYVISRRLLSGPLGRALGGALPDAVSNLGRRLHDRYAGQFTTTQAASDDEVIKSRPKMSEYLGTLEVAGVVDLIEKGKGNKPSIWQMKGEVPEAGARWLPTLDALQEVESCQTV